MSAYISADVDAIKNSLSHMEFRLYSKFRHPTCRNDIFLIQSNSRMHPVQLLNESRYLKRDGYIFRNDFL